MINIIAENISSATITALTENPDLTFADALIDSTLAKVGRTVDIDDQWIKLAYAAAVDCDTVVLMQNNIQSTATVKIQANATDSWGSPSVDQALTFTKDYRRSNELGRDIGVWSYQFSTTQSYQYWRIFVDDSTNPDGYIELSFVFMDENIVFPGMSVNQTFTRQTTSEPEFSESNQVYGIKRVQYNVANFVSPVVTESEKTTIDSFFNQVDLVTPYCMLVWENSLDVQRPLYVVNLKLPEWKRIETQSGLLWTFNMEIREVF